MCAVRSVRHKELRLPAGILAMLMLVLVFSGSASAEEVTGAHDNLRTGWYPDESSLTPELVKSGAFTQAFRHKLEGQIYAQPLIADGTLLVVTEADRAYGLDPVTGEERWPHKELGVPASAEDPEIECADLAPTIGVTGTPVISNGIAYFVANRYRSGSSGPLVWEMHALEMTTGKEAPHFPVKIEGEAQNLSGVKFVAPKEMQRPALLFMNGTVYAAFGSHCDKAPFQGWIAGVSAATGSLTTLWSTSRSGGSIWQAGGGLVSDGPGQILFSTGNAPTSEPETWDPPKGSSGKQKPPPEGKLDESVVRVEAQANGELETTDYFSPFNDKLLDENDLDLGSSAPIALPSPYFGTNAVPHLLVQAGKQGYVYLLNRDELGGRGTTEDRVVQRTQLFGGVWDAAAVWPGEGGHIYIPAVSPPENTLEQGDHLRFFAYRVNGETPELRFEAESPDIFAFGSGSPIVTSNEVQNGSAILWTTWCPSSPGACKEAELRAYDPVPAEKTTPQIFRHFAIGQASKFSRPYAHNGHIYVGNRQGEIIAFSAPQLTASASALNLGEAAAGRTLVGTVAFTNTGSGSLTVTGVEPVAPPFTATGLPKTGTVLKQGESVSVEVAFNSFQPGTFNGSLGVTTQAGTTRVPVSAAVPAPEPPPEPPTEPPTEHHLQPTVTTATLTPPGPGSTSGTPLIPLLAHLAVRPPAARGTAKARVTFTLSASGVVELAVFRRVRSHHCRAGVHPCYGYVPTKIHFKVFASTASNAIAIGMGHLPVGVYRLTATPIATSGARGATRYFDFHDPR